MTKISLYSNNNFLEQEDDYTYDKLFRLESQQIKMYKNGVKTSDIKNEYYYDQDNLAGMIEYQGVNNVTKDYGYYYDSTHKNRLSYIEDYWTGDKVASFTYNNVFYKPNSMTLDGKTYDLEWDGKELKKFGTSTFEYNILGIRTKRAYPGTVAKYELDGDKVIAMTLEQYGNVSRMEFNYDINNNLIGLTLEDKEYIYIRDMLGNIKGIIDQNGKVIVYYKYDAWGKVLSEEIIESNLASRYNPFLYKGYIYDKETGWYYYNS